MPKLFCLIERVCGDATHLMLTVGKNLDVNAFLLQLINQPLEYKFNSTITLNR